MTDVLLFVLLLVLVIHSHNRMGLFCTLPSSHMQAALLRISVTSNARLLLQCLGGLGVVGDAVAAVEEAEPEQHQICAFGHHHVGMQFPFCVSPTRSKPVIYI
jgi:hypothetical protein